MTQERTQASREDVALLCMAYGTPRSMEELEEFYTHIRGGRRPSPELLEELRARYEAIGGSPLAEITDEQAEGVAAELNRRELPYRFQPFVGMKHSHPFIHETVEAIAKAGFQRIVGLTLAPQYSRMSVGAYIGSAQNAVRHAEEQLGIRLQASFIECWHLAPSFVNVLAKRVERALQGLPGAHVLYTAHSLPERILEWEDPYPRHLRETAEAVSARANVSDWSCAYQSAGKSSVPWLGPDLLEALEELAKKGCRRVVVCPAGFVADHLEVLYDIDVEARQRAGELGLELARTESLNASPDFLSALADVVAAHLKEGVVAWRAGGQR